ncbi:hypothetical protein F2P81_018419, partial [Scophthalmus maximus]
MVGCSVEEASLTVGELVGFHSVKSASGMNSAILIFLDDVAKVEQVVENGIVVLDTFMPVLPLVNPATKIIISNAPPFMKNDLAKELSCYGQLVSPINLVLLGSKSPKLKHVVCHRRQVTFSLTFSFKVEGFSYVVFATSETMTCIGSGEEGHLIRSCPEKREQAGPSPSRPGPTGVAVFQTFCRAGILTLGSVVEHTGPALDNAAALAARLSMRSVRIISRLLDMGKRSLTDHKLLMIKDYSDGFIVPNANDPFSCLALRSGFNVTDGLMSVHNIRGFNLDQAKVSINSYVPILHSWPHNHQEYDEAVQTVDLPADLWLSDATVVLLQHFNYQLNVLYICMYSKGNPRQTSQMKLRLFFLTGQVTETKHQTYTMTTVRKKSQVTNFTFDIKTIVLAVYIYKMRQV